MVNRVCARPHRPRDAKIREICSWAGVTWPEPVRNGNVRDEEEESEFEEHQEEEEEEEEFTDDEETIPLPGACIQICDVYNRYAPLFALFC